MRTTTAPPAHIVYLKYHGPARFRTSGVIFAAHPEWHYCGSAGLRPIGAWAHMGLAAESRF